MKKAVILMILVVTVMSFSSCVSEEAKAVQNAIDALPENYSESAESQFCDVQDKYEKLNFEDKRDVNTDRLNKLEGERDAYFDSVAETINKKISDINFSELNNKEEIDDTNTDLKELIGLIKKAPTIADNKINYSDLNRKINNISINDSTGKYAEYSQKINSKQNDALNDILEAATYYSYGYSSNSASSLRSALRAMDDVLDYFDKMCAGLSGTTDTRNHCYKAYKSLESADGNFKNFDYDTYTSECIAFSNGVKTILGRLTDEAENQLNSMEKLESTIDEYDSILNSRGLN